MASTISSKDMFAVFKKRSGNFQHCRFN